MPVMEVPMLRPTLWLAALGLSAPAFAATIHVNPGPAALQTAIDNASPGDTLRVHAGTYGETIQIEKPLRIIGDGTALVTLDGGCTSDATVELSADQVKVKKLTIKGGSYYAVDLGIVSRAVVADNVVVESCGTALYGINLRSGTDARVMHNDISGFDDGGIYIGGFFAGTKVSAARNTCHDNFSGIIVESSADSRIILRSNTLTANEDGIYLGNSDDVILSRNTVTGSTHNGIWLAGGSDTNRAVGNTVSGSANADVVDDGAGNCWRNNVFTTGSVVQGICP